MHEEYDCGNHLHIEKAAKKLPGRRQLENLPEWHKRDL